MPLPKILQNNLSIPVIGAPLFLVSGPELVIAQCKAGIVGAFPALNARPQTVLEEWLIRIKKELAENKISQMKEAALKEIKDSSIRLAMESVKKIISTSIDKSKLDTLFERNLEESKIAIKKIKT